MKKIISLFAITALVISCQTTRPYTATNNPIGSKKGASETSFILGVSSGENLVSGIVLNKEFGVIDAAKKGNINKIATVDVKYTNYLLFGKAKIIVTGE